jgi:hypothetical protein
VDCVGVATRGGSVHAPAYPPGGCLTDRCTVAIAVGPLWVHTVTDFERPRRGWGAAGAPTWSWAGEEAPHERAAASLAASFPPA